MDRLVYSPEAYARVRAGEVKDRNDKDGGEQSVQALILSALREAGKALTSGEILDVVRQDEGAAARLAVRPQLGYNAISRMARRGKLVRDGKLYKLADASYPERDRAEGELAFD